MKILKKIAIASAVIVVGVFVVTLLLLAVIDGVLTTKRVASILKNQIESHLHATATFEVTRFSIFHGIELKHISLQGLYDSKPVFSCEAVNIRYSLPSLFIGKIAIHSIDIIRPTFFFEEKKGVWNFQRLIKSKTDEDTDEIKDEHRQDDQRKEIILPFPIEVVFSFNIVDLSCIIKGSTFSAQLNDFSTSVRFHIPRTFSIPMGVMAISLFDAFDISINPKEVMKASFTSQQLSVGQPLLFTFALTYDPHQRRFASSFKCGTLKTPVRFVQSHLAPLNASISYDIVYLPSRDVLTCNYLRIIFNNDTWISFAGNIHHVNTSPTISFAMVDSNIRLFELYRYTRTLIGEKPYFKGILSLFPLTITGDGECIAVQGQIKGSNLHFAVDNFSIEIPRINVPYMVDISQDHIRVAVDINVPSFTYILNDERSRQNGLQCESAIVYNKTNSSVAIDYVRIIHRASELASNAIVCELKGTVKLADALKAVISINPLMIDVPRLASTLPPQLKQALAASPFTKPITIQVTSELSFTTTAKKFTAQALCILPDYNIDDLRIDASLRMDSKINRMTIDTLAISLAKQLVSLQVRGRVDLREATAVQLYSFLRMHTTNPLSFGDYLLNGFIQASVQVSGLIDTLQARGNIVIQNGIVKNDAKKLFIGPVHLKLPFDYQRGVYTTLVYDSSEAMRITLTRPHANFSIGRITIKHPTRDVPIEYIKNLHGYIGVDHNIVEIKNVQANVLGGVVTIKEFLFNLADLNPKNMGFKVLMTVHDVDIGKLDKPEKKQINPDSLLSLYAQVSGNDFTSYDMNMSGSINIYKVGEKFANRLFKGLNEERGKSKLGMAQIAVDNSLIITGFDFYIDKGLIYPTVFFKKKIIGLIVTVNNEQVRYERVPVMEFFNKVREDTL